MAVNVDGKKNMDFPSNTTIPVRPGKSAGSLLFLIKKLHAVKFPRGKKYIFTFSFVSVIKTELHCRVNVIRIGGC